MCVFGWVGEGEEDERIRTNICLIKAMGWMGGLGKS